jgi:hypothetical protein
MTPQSSSLFQPRKSSIMPANSDANERRPSTLNLFGSLLNQLKSGSPHTSTNNSPRGSQLSINGGAVDGEVTGKGALDFIRFGTNLTTVCCGVSYIR